MDGLITGWLLAITTATLVYIGYALYFCLTEAPPIKVRLGLALVSILLVSYVIAAWYIPNPIFLTGTLLAAFTIAYLWPYKTPPQTPKKHIQEKVVFALPFVWLAWVVAVGIYLKV